MPVPAIMDTNNSIKCNSEFKYTHATNVGLAREEFDALTYGTYMQVVKVKYDIKYK